jgi:GTP-binding protein Era
MAAEIIREQILLGTEEEVPYSTTVQIEEFEESRRLTRISAVIYCEREGQKGILVGTGGQTLKKIGTAARLRIERMLGGRVFLQLFVKVRPCVTGRETVVIGNDFAFRPNLYRIQTQKASI